MSIDPDLSWSECDERDLPDPGTPVRTACGGTVKYSRDVPCVMFRGERVFFCLPACKDDFVANPLYSCMAIRIQEMELLKKKK